VDFGILTPFGNRLLRKIRLTGPVPGPGGTLRQIEILGPASFEMFTESWIILRNLCIFEDVCDFGLLTRLFDKRFKDNHDKFGHPVWHLFYQQIVRAFGEHVPAIRTRAIRERNRALAKVPPEPHPYDPSRPWQYVLTKLVEDNEWWRDNFDEPAAHILRSQNKVPPLVAAAVGTDAPIEGMGKGYQGPILQPGASFATPRKGGAPPQAASPKKRKHKDAHNVTGDGDAARYTTNRNWTSLCSDFNGPAGCDTSHPSWPGVCPKDWAKAHQCDRCFSPHHGSTLGNCTSTPRVPNYLNRGSPKGKGNKGGGKKGGGGGKASRKGW
jgi:hypothetical protein